MPMLVSHDTLKVFLLQIRLLFPLVTDTENTQASISLVVCYPKVKNEHVLKYPILGS